MGITAGDRVHRNGTRKSTPGQPGSGSAKAESRKEDTTPSSVVRSRALHLHVGWPTSYSSTRDRVQPSVERSPVTLDVAAALAEYGEHIWRKSTAGEPTSLRPSTQWKQTTLQMRGN